MNIKKIIYIALAIACLSCELSLGQEISYTLEKQNVEKAKYSVPLRMCRGINGIKTKKKIVALTFDDGPHKKYTPEILAVLKEYNIKATFFIIGKNAKNYPNIVKAIYVNGHDIGNHTYSHYYLTKLSNEDIENEIVNANRIIKQEIYTYPRLFRPPYGACSKRSVAIIKGIGMISIGWSDMTDDYNVDKTTPEKIANEIIKYARPGAIIGMHDGGGNREKTAKALPIIIKTLKAQGYKFLTITDLLGVAAYNYEE